MYIYLLCNCEYGQQVFLFLISAGPISCIMLNMINLSKGYIYMPRSLYISAVKIKQDVGSNLVHPFCSLLILGQSVSLILKVLNFISTLFLICLYFNMGFSMELNINMDQYMDFYNFKYNDSFIVFTDPIYSAFNNILSSELRDSKIGIENSIKEAISFLFFSQYLKSFFFKLKKMKVSKLILYILKRCALIFVIFLYFIYYVDPKVIYSYLITITLYDLAKI